MATQIIDLKTDEYEILTDEPKNLDEPDKKSDPFGNSMLYAGIGVLALIFLLIKKKK